MNKSKTDGKKCRRKTAPPRRTPPPSPRIERGNTQGDTHSGRRNIRVNRRIVSNIETEDSTEYYEEDNYHPQSPTPPLDFEPEEEYEDDKEFENTIIDAPCFRIIVTRNNVSKTDSESYSSESKDTVDSVAGICTTKNLTLSKSIQYFFPFRKKCLF